MAQRVFLEASDRATSAAFLDVEASGLGSKSWPIEVGWAFGDGKSSSFLVKPAPDWDDDAWEQSAERLHGISRHQLAKEGLDPTQACLLLNRALSNVRVYSDAPDWDGFWLFRLFAAGGVKQEFSLRDFGRLVRPLAGARRESVLARAGEIAPRRHRAAADALHLQTLFQLAREQATNDRAR